MIDTLDGVRKNHLHPGAGEGKDPDDALILTDPFRGGSDEGVLLDLPFRSSR